MSNRRLVPDAPEPAARALYDDDILHITGVRTPDTTLVRLDGEIDATNSDAVRSTLTQTRRRQAHVVVDVGRVTFADVTGARTLADFSRDSHNVRLRHVPRQMKRVLEMVNLSGK